MRKEGGNPLTNIRTPTGRRPAAAWPATAQSRPCRPPPLGLRARAGPDPRGERERRRREEKKGREIESKE